MPRSVVGAALATAAAFLLAGCADRTLIYNDTVTVGYSPTEYGYAAGRRDLATVVEGNPFDVEQEVFQDAVIAALNRHPPPLQPTNFTTTPGDSAREPYRVVFLFDVPVAVNSFRMCAEPRAVPQADTGSTFRVAAAFCRGGRLLSTATGQNEGVEEIDDPGFEALLADVVDALFPPTDPTRDGDDRIRLRSAAD